MILNRISTIDARHGDGQRSWHESNTGFTIGISETEEDGSVGELQVARRLFSDVEVGAGVDPALFELPFPVQDAR